jgi:hypothetical protein
VAGLQGPAVEVERHGSLEIQDRRNRHVVTFVTLLSPSTKALGANRDDYMAMRRQVFAGMTNLVEIDLSRGGTRPTPPKSPACDYTVFVSRYERRATVEFWPLSLRRPLPVVPIPLRPPDPDVHLELQAVLHRAYDAADYGKYIYSETPEPPLTPDDAAWARQFVPASSRGDA